MASSGSGVASSSTSAVAGPMPASAQTAAAIAARSSPVGQRDELHDAVHGGPDVDGRREVEADRRLAGVRRRRQRRNAVDRSDAAGDDDGQPFAGGVASRRARAADHAVELGDGRLDLGVARLRDTGRASRRWPAGSASRSRTWTPSTSRPRVSSSSGGEVAGEDGEQAAALLGRRDERHDEMVARAGERDVEQAQPLGGELLPSRARPSPRSPT